MDLEANHGLDPNNPSHIWLLHTLFLPSIQQDTQEWSESWNSHKLQVRRRRQRSPRDMFLFGMFEEGVRGLTPLNPPTPPNDDITVDDLSGYGIDWEVVDNPQLMSHLHSQNPQDTHDNPFVPASTPARLSEVICDPPNCPFASDELQLFQERLCSTVDTSSRDMNVRRLVWQAALDLAAQIFDHGAEAS